MNRQMDDEINKNIRTYIERKLAAEGQVMLKFKPKKTITEKIEKAANFLHEYKLFMQRNLNIARKKYNFEEFKVAIQNERWQNWLKKYAVFFEYDDKNKRVHFYNKFWKGIECHAKFDK